MCKVFVDYYHLAVIIKCISCLYVMNSVLLKNFNFCGAVNIGDVAQLAERPPCTRKASGSNPLISTRLQPQISFFSVRPGWFAERIILERVWCSYPIYKVRLGNKL